MLIKSVILKNIRSYINVKIDFKGGSTLLSGDIGAGKSTILLSVEFALFGFSSNVDGSSLLRNGEESGFVDLKFSVDEKEVNVRRYLKRFKESVRQDAGYIIYDGRKYDGTPIELKARIIEILGYPKDLITKSKSLIYRYTVYTPQEEMKHILFEDSGARLDTLRKVFQIDKYKRIQENLQISTRSVRDRVRELDFMTRDSELLEMEKKSVVKDLQLIEEKISVLVPEISRISSKISEAKKIQDSWTEKLTVLHKHTRNLDVLQSKVYEKTRNIKQHESDVIRMAGEISQIKVKLSGHKDLESEFADLLWLANLELDYLSKITMSREQLRASQLQLEEELTGFSAQIKNQGFVIESSKTLLSKITSLDLCPTCRQDVRQDHKNHILETENLKISSARSLQEQAQKQQLEKRTQLEKIRQELDKVLDAEKKILLISSIIGQQLPAPRQTSVVFSLDRLKILRLQISEQAHLPKILEDKENNIRLLNDVIAVEKTELAALAPQIEQERQSILRLKDVESNIAQAKSIVESLLQNEKTLLVERASFISRKSGLEKSISDLDSKLGEKSKLLDERDKLSKLSHWLDEYFMGLVQSIERQVMLRVFNEFNSFFQHWFGILLESSTISIRLDEEFSPVIEQNGFEISFDNLSGGEKTSCALAYRLALNKVINDLVVGIKTRDIIILDEPTDGFSNEQLEKLRDVIAELNFSQVIIVSHEKKIESFVENVIRVSKEEHVSRVESA